MAGPNILNAGEDNTAADTDTTYYFTSTITSGTNTFSNVSAPATAKTAIVFIICDKAFSEGFTITSDITWGSLPSIAQINMDPDSTAQQSTRVARAAVFDLSSQGAIDETLSFNTSHSSSNGRYAMVVCTDGFVQSIHCDGARSADGIYNIAYNPNADTCGLLSMVGANGDITSTDQTGTKLFNSNSGGLSAIAYYNASLTNTYHEVEFTGDANSVYTTLTALISTMPDPFGGITGKLTSPLLK